MDKSKATKSTEPVGEKKDSQKTPKSKSQESVPREEVVYKPSEGKGKATPLTVAEKDPTKDTKPAERDPFKDTKPASRRQVSEEPLKKNDKKNSAPRPTSLPAKTEADISISKTTKRPDSPPKPISSQDKSKSTNVGKKDEEKPKNVLKKEETKPLNVSKNDKTKPVNNEGKNKQTDGKVEKKENIKPTNVVKDEAKVSKTDIKPIKVDKKNDTNAPVKQSTKVKDTNLKSQQSAQKSKESDKDDLQEISVLSTHDTSSQQSVVQTYQRDTEIDIEAATERDTWIDHDKSQKNVTPEKNGKKPHKPATPHTFGRVALGFLLTTCLVIIAALLTAMATGPAPFTPTEEYDAVLDSLQKNWIQTGPGIWKVLGSQSIRQGHSMQYLLINQANASFSFRTKSEQYWFLQSGEAVHLYISEDGYNSTSLLLHNPFKTVQALTSLPALGIVSTQQNDTLNPTDANFGFTFNAGTNITVSLPDGYFYALIGMVSP